MKIKNFIIKMCLLAGVATGLTACQNSFDDPALQTPVATMEANTTIAEFKDAFMNEPNRLCPYKDADKKVPYIVKGRVISSDATGNIYQTLSLQDETAAMTFAIRRAGLYDYYSVGQEVVVNLTDLWVGQYNYLMQIGWLGESSTGLPQMSRVDFSLFQTHAELNGLPEKKVSYVNPGDDYPADNMYCIIENIDQLPTAPGPEFYKLQGQLVEFRNVSFEDGGEVPYARFQESVSRYITQDGNSSKLCVYNSGYATFYNDMLPAGKGTVRGILSYYSSDPSYASSDGSVTGWQLLIRSLEDVEIDTKGTKEKPYTIEEAVGKMDQGYSGWLEGYIVGSVKAGVSKVNSNNDIIFGKDAELDNTLVIAPEADVTDWSKCVVVNLPQGSALRKYGNLLDNPTVYKKSIAVDGAFDSMLGMPGVEGTGAADTFIIDGVELEPGTPEKQGDGTEENPYTIAQVMASTADATGVWVEGYLVGYVADKYWDTAVFGTTASETDNYKNATNCIMSSVEAGAASDANSVPVGLSNTGTVRTTLGISKNPSIYGQKVKVKGDITKYFGVRGVKNVSDYRLDGDTPVTPVTPSGDETIYECFSQSSATMTSGWTIQNEELPSALKEIWSWKSYQGRYYLNGSAFASNKAYAAKAYAISPEIDLSGYKSASVSFDHAANFQTTIKELCGICVRVAGSTDWNNLTIAKWPTAGTWTWTNSGTIDLSAYAGKKIQIAFRYGSSDKGADTWEIDNVKITGSK